MKKKPLPELYKIKEECCGCGVCYISCPVKSADGTCAIMMLPDSEGFLYPMIDKNKCIRCYKCIDVCVFKHQRD